METNQKIILYVDDDRDDLAMFRQVIEATAKSYRIVEAFDGIHALELLKQMAQTGELPSLIVLDINMPRMDGKQTLVAIQNDKTYASIPIVLFSTSSNQLDKTFSESRKVELITKPFNFETLFKITHKLLSYYNV